MDQNSKAKYDLCATCYLEGKEPGNQTNTQYTRVENPTYSAMIDREAPWTDAETLRLLEALERYDEDWGEIAEHVGTRTREECVLAFLQLDIEDRYLETERLDPPTGIQMLGPHGGLLPFNNVENPVMSVVAFLASIADPESAAAAANLSADVLRQNLRKKLESSSDASQTNGKGKDKEGEDSMEVDGNQEAEEGVVAKITSSDLANIPLAAMGARAGGLASQEEREMTRLVSSAMNVTLEKMELKMKYFGEMEAMLQAERRELERARQQLFLDRLAFKRRVRDVQDILKKAVTTGGEQGYKLAQTAVADGEKLSFHPAPPVGSVQPLSADGQAKSYEA